jgi:thioredoxin reductase (NADPH)
VWLGDNEYLGGCDAVLEYLRNKFMGSQQEEKKNVGMVPDGVEMGAYDYDLVCIGGGSGGLALTKEAANLGAKVACLDFVKPSPHGTTWGLGGTCVNVGCIPKKLCHRAAIVGEEIAHDAKAFGWTTAGPAKHSWSTLQDNVHDYISSLNFKYRVALREKKVTYLNKLGKIVDAHTLELTDRKGKTSTITAGRIVVAVGGRPTELSIPGGEHAINSDDVFQMDWTETENKEPGKTLVIGASYVALECAGFFTALGYDTSVMVRSILLRGFDREYSDKIGEYMEQTGTKFIRGTVPSQIEKLESGKYKVFWNEGKDSDEFDTVVTAIGRYADTPKLGLDSVGIKTASNGKIICENDNEQTNIPNIYAIGDVVQGMLELTPVAIQSGIMLARRLYGNSKELMDYSKIPTTVFTPIEYGCCGLSEEDAIAKYGQDDLEVFHKELAPLEWELLHDKPKGIARAKLICLKSENLRVVGLHILGPNCGEITQGFALGMKKGATYQDFQDTVGIHPTVAEDFTTMTVTKASGEDAGAAGC